MSEKAFNLLHEPWIAVIHDTGETELVSMLSLYGDAHRWRGLAGELPTQDVAVMRLLLAVLHAVFARYDAAGTFAPIESPQDALLRWKNLHERGTFPTPPIEAYLNHYADRFWLIHPEHPFYQVPRLDNATDYTAPKLNGELSESGNKVRLFPQRTGTHKMQLTYAEAARWLLYVNAFDDTSAKPKGKGLPSPGAGWLGKLGLILAVGENLFQTLMLNLVLLRDGEDQLWDAENPVWEREVKTEQRTAIVLPDNPSELLTLQSRRLNLHRTGTAIIGYSLLGGDFFPRENAFAEQMTIWRASATKKEGTPEYTPRRHDPSRQIWRDFAPLVSRREGVRRPGLVNWLARLTYEGLLPQKHFRFQTAAVSYGDKDFFVDDVFSDSLSLSTKLLTDLSQHWVERISYELEVTEGLVYRVSELAQRLAKASGDANGDAQRHSAKQQAYFRLDKPFRDWLESIDPEGADMDTVCDAWWQQARRIVRTLGKELVEQCGPQAFIGRVAKEGSAGQHHSAPLAYNRFLSCTTTRESLKGGKQV